MPAVAIAALIEALAESGLTIYAGIKQANALNQQETITPEQLAEIEATLKTVLANSATVEQALIALRTAALAG